MGSGAGAHRYIGGKTPGKYFKDDVWPTLGDLFEKLLVIRNYSNCHGARKIYNHVHLILTQFHL